MLIKVLTQENGFLSDPFIQGILSGVAVAIIGQIISAFIQAYFQSKQHKFEYNKLELQLKENRNNLDSQLYQSQKNLELQLRQSEENIKLTILANNQKQSLEKLWEIVHSDLSSYTAMKDKLKEFIDSSDGYYLPKTVYQTIQKEIGEADLFIYKSQFDLGLLPPEPSDEEFEKLWEDWIDDMSQEELLAMDINQIYSRFKGRLKNELRKAMSK